jgi:hypothetical protein
MHLEEVLEVAQRHTSAIVGYPNAFLRRGDCDLNAWRDAWLNVLEAVDDVFPNDCRFILESGGGREKVATDV